ncbi:rNA polymerase sigma-24 subunit ECF subfamily [Eubacterium sp. CAG:841]|nr:rNA polymerase sigma-24 subunit ECF subfamily [Eubacterium sp. CAG:841]
MENLLQDISFESTYMKYCNMLISNCCYMGAKNRYDAEEIVDDVFALLYIKWNSLESHAESVVLKWLNITLRNVTYSYVRRKNKQARMLAEAEREASILRAEKKSACSDEEYNKLLEKLYAEMNEAEMLLFDCIINNDMTLKDVSILTEENVNTVKSRWLRLRKKLEKRHFKKK